MAMTALICSTTSELFIGTTAIKFESFLREIKVCDVSSPEAVADEESCESSRDFLLKNDSKVKTGLMNDIEKINNSKKEEKQQKDEEERNNEGNSEGKGEGNSEGEGEGISPGFYEIEKSE
jgi:hypothetical protein